MKLILVGVYGKKTDGSKRLVFSGNNAIAFNLSTDGTLTPSSKI